MGAHTGVQRDGGVEEPAQELHAGGVVPHVAGDDPARPNDPLRLRQGGAEIRHEVEDEAGTTASTEASSQPVASAFPTWNVTRGSGTASRA